MTALNLAFIAFMLFLSLTSARAEEIGNVKLFSSMMTSEDAVLDNIINNYIPIIFLERPYDREQLRKKIKEWNLQIKDWSKLTPQQNIYVYRKNNLFDVNVGYHIYNNKEFVNETESIGTVNYGPTFNISWTRSLALNSFLQFEYRYLKKNDFTPKESNQTYTFKPTNSYFVNYKHFFPKQNLFAEVGISYEEISYLSYNSTLYFFRDEIFQNLQVSNVTSYWLSAGLSYRLSPFKNGSYLGLSFGKSLKSEKRLSDKSLVERMSGHRIEGSYKIYFWQFMWFKLYGMYVNTKALQKVEHTQYGLQTGFTF